MRKYLVTLLTDDGDRVVVTRKRWTNYAGAELYAKWCAKSRNPLIEVDYEDAIWPPVDKASSNFSNLSDLRFSDNTGTVGWTSIHAKRWGYASVWAATRLCPEGNFTATSYISGDERHGWTIAQRANAQRYGVPIYMLYNGAYFSFPVDENGGKLLIALGMTTELLRLMAAKGKDISLDKDVTTT